jgi:AraC family transcriptional regulator
MDKIDPRLPDPLLSQQVTDSRYFFLDLAASGSPGLAVTLGGRETCRPDYVIARRAYAYHGIEYVAEGEGWVVLDGVRQELQPGTVFGYAPDTPCEIHTDPHHPLVKYFVCFAGRGAAVRLKSTGLGRSLVCRLEAHAEVRSVAEDLIREGRRTTPQARAICQTLFELLLLRIEEAAGPVAKGADPSRDNFLRCKALIDAHAERLATLEQIAARAGLEASSVCRLFRRFQGTSPYQYLLRRKMNLAAEFLVEHGGLVKEAAERVGYADPYHFSRNFKAVHGISPRALLLRRRVSV